jgi:DICT domain-containing protein
MGNQPRMKLDGSKSSENTIVYAYVDATNVKSDRDPRMHDLTLTFKDRDHFSQEWTLRIEGKNNTTVYEFERVKGPEQSQGW